jgi:hypothetical protein
MGRSGGGYPLVLAAVGFIPPRCRRTLIDTLLVFEPSRFVAFTANFQVPTALGVPMISPDAESDKPAGSRCFNR